MKDRQRTDIKQIEHELLKVIETRIGLIISPSQTHKLYEIVEKECKKHRYSPSTYLDLLKAASEHSPLLKTLVHAMTIGESYFFRDKKQMELLENKILPELIERKSKEQSYTLRIWSAGCSRGEEIYTVAMMLDRLIIDKKKWTIQLLGTDIDTDKLNDALIGKYGRWSMRGIPDYYKTRYFSEKNQKFYLSKKIKTAATFIYHNLIENTYPSQLNHTEAQDLILCRNVFIYFDLDLIKNIIHQLSLCLSPGGFLLLGPADPFILEGCDLIHHTKEGMVFYRPDLEHPSEIHGEKIPSLEPTPQAKKEPQDVVLKCKEILSSDPTNKMANFHLGLAYVERNQFEEAEQSFRRSIYLDHRFTTAYFQLGLLLIRKKQFKRALKNLENALHLVDEKNPAEIIDELQNMNYKLLREILIHEISMVKTRLSKGPSS